MISQGTYRARPKSATLSVSGSGKEQVSVVFDLLDPGFEGQTLQWWGYFSSDKAVEIAVKALRTCGWQGNDLQDLTSVDPECEVELVVELEEYEGKTRPKVKWVNAPGGPTAPPLEAQKAKAFAASMKARIAALEGGAPRTTTRKPAPAPKPADADVPF